MFGSKNWRNTRRKPDSVSRRLVRSQPADDEDPYTNLRIHEAKIMEEFGTPPQHPNLVRLFNLSGETPPWTLAYPPPPLTEELGRLREGKNMVEPPNATQTGSRLHIKYEYDQHDLLTWVWQIVDALDFVHSRNVVHCHIAAQNVSFYGKGLVKLTNFGSAHKVKENQTEFRVSKSSKEDVPWNWWSPELMSALLGAVGADDTFPFSKASDVWSFAVFMHEVFELGAEPYGNADCESVFGLLNKGVRMSCPEYAPLDLYKIMEKCWELEPGRRMKLSDLKRALMKIMSPNPSRKQFLPIAQMQNLWRPTEQSSPADLSVTTRSIVPEIDVDDVKLLLLCNKGAFGVVYKASLAQQSKHNQQAKIVAVKCIRDDFKTATEPARYLAMGMLQNELDVLAYINYVKGGHPNVVQLIGACTRGSRRDVRIVMDYCDLGSVEAFIAINKSNFQGETYEPSRTAPEAVMSTFRCSHGYVSASLLDQKFDVGDIVGWCRDTASGMAWSAGIGVVHRDLAPRNIVLNKSRVAKVADFGFSSYGDKNPSCTTMHPPWQETAPETLRNSLEFTSKSDVWSFGVAMWVMLTLGEEPYGDRPVLTADFVDLLQVGKVGLPRPPLATDTMLQIMQGCWKFDASERPDFVSLMNRLDKLTVDMKSCSFRNAENV